MHDDSSGGPILIGRPLSLDDLAAVARRGARVALCPLAREKVQRARDVVEDLTREAEEGQEGRIPPPDVYGVNTGFGALSETKIDIADVRRLQQNLIRSHACGVGPALADDHVRGMILLRAQVLAMGHSGVRPALIDRLITLLNDRVIPEIPSQGSVGASGDLAPLAHLALVLTGEGGAKRDGGETFRPAARVLAEAGISPIVLEAKEGLSLINGTQYMTSLGGLAMVDAAALVATADIAGAMTLEALKGSSRPFDERLMEVRPHPGQAKTAANLRKLLAASEIMESHRHCGRVQDAYSLRCMPQVHGASRDALTWGRQVIEREVNSVTDNPLIFVDEHGAAEVISGGNFHGQPLAFALDFAAIALAELGNISERRVEQLVNPALSSGLTPFLAATSGLESGLMIAQVASASLVSENKIFCHPASVDSIPSSAGKEDHVSMGSISARKLLQVVTNVRHVLAIELLAASVGIDQRAPFRPGTGVDRAHAVIREVVPPLLEDRPLYVDIAQITEVLRSGKLEDAVREAVGGLVD